MAVAHETIVAFMTQSPAPMPSHVNCLEKSPRCINLTAYRLRSDSEILGESSVSKLRIELALPTI